MTNVPWITIKERKPADREKVFLLFGAQESSSESDLEQWELYDDIMLSYWSEGSECFFNMYDDQLPITHTCYWYPVLKEVDSVHAEVAPHYDEVTRKMLNSGELFTMRQFHYLALKKKEIMSGD